MVKSLSKRWEKLPVVRTRIRKSKPWLKLKEQPENKEKPWKNKDVILDTEALRDNSCVLLETLQHYGLVLQPIPDLTDQAVSYHNMLISVRFSHKWIQ